MNKPQKEATGGMFVCMEVHDMKLHNLRVAKVSL